MMQQHPQQQQPQRFYNNHNNNNNFNNGNRPKPSHHQTRPMLVQQYQQQQAPPPAVNPFIPLQASRKATKAKNLPFTQKSTVKEVAPQDVPALPTTSQTVARIEQEIFNTSQTATEPKVVNSKPTVDIRKSRLAISFGK